MPSTKCSIVSSICAVGVIAIVILSGLEIAANFHSGVIVRDSFDHVFWSGDLNYRVNVPCGTFHSPDDSPPPSFADVVADGNEELSEQMSQNLAFSGYTEGEIDFPPTYRYTLGSDDFNDKCGLIPCSCEDPRIPSWTDRVLHCGSGAILNSYVSVRSVRSSDHKPVVAVYSVPLTLSGRDIDLKVCVSTWNRGGQRADEMADSELDDLDVYLPKDCDVNVVGTEESESVAGSMASVFNSVNFGSWEGRLKDSTALSGLEMISSAQVGATHIAVFANELALGGIDESSIESCAISTGQWRFFSNKGGAGVRFDLADVSFAFVNSHLAAGTAKGNNVKDRNSNYHQIEENLFRGLCWTESSGFKISLVSLVTSFLVIPLIAAVSFCAYRLFRPKADANGGYVAGRNC
eukprot:938193_1